MLWWFRSLQCFVFCFIYAQHSWSRKNCICFVVYCLYNWVTTFNQSDVFVFQNFSFIWHVWYFASPVVHACVLSLLHLFLFGNLGNFNMYNGSQVYSTLFKTTQQRFILFPRCSMTQFFFFPDYKSSIGPPWQVHYYFC